MDSVIEKNTMRSLTRPRLLLLSDEAMSRTLLEAFLGTEQNQLIVASDLDEMRHSLQRGDIDLAILDMTLPGTDCIAACRDLRRGEPDRRIPLILLTPQAITVNRSKALDAGADDVIGKPFRRNDLTVRLHALLRIKSLHDQIDEVEQMMLSLSKILESKASHTAAHTERVASLVEAIARELGMSTDDVRMLRRAALFHDIGKAAIPELILNKPRSLTHDEVKVLRQQSLLPTQSTATRGVAAQILPIIRHHNEHLDGTGYPDGLIGDQIPLGARILSVADAYDAMVSHRPYRPALTPEKAAQQLRAGAGTQWDEDVVAALLLHLAAPLASHA